MGGTDLVADAVEALKRGLPVLVFDSEGRERETDIFFLAEKVDHHSIRLLRRDAGGLICVSLHPKIADVLGLPFLRELLALYSSKLKTLYVKPLPYDERSAFSITINHVDTFTGISDRDRARTISRLGELCRMYWTRNISEDELCQKFLSEFRSPGHVFLLRAANNIVFERQGHTELAIALAMLGNLTPCVVLAEMLGDDGYSLSMKDAKEYARRHGYVFLEGKVIIEEFKRSFGGKTA